MRNRIVVAAVVLVGVGVPMIGAAQAPAQIPVQGYLTDEAGAAINGSQTMAFAIHTVETGGTPLFTESQSVMVDEGYFTAYVGDVSVLDLAAFRDNSTLYMGVTIGGEELLPRMALATVPYAAYAQYAGDAATVGGVTAAALAAPAWGAITGVPADIADGDQDTTYTAGAGLTLTGTQFSADTSGLQARVSATCPPGQSIRVIDSTGGVTCEVDDVGVTYTAGTGITLLGTTLSADTAYLQRRVTAGCPPGQSIRAIDGAGGVTCEVDDTGPTYGAGTGLSLVGTTFSADTAYLQRRVTGTCPAGQAMQSVGATGTVGCAALPDESRSASDTSGATTPLTASCQNYAGAAVTITTPSAGRVTVFGQAWMLFNHTAGAATSFYTTIGTTPTDCASAVYWARHEIPSAYPTSTSTDVTLNPQRDFTVPGAGTYTYYLNGLVNTGAATFWFANLQAVFTPN